MLLAWGSAPNGPQISDRVKDANAVACDLGDCICVRIVRYVGQAPVATAGFGVPAEVALPLVARGVEDGL